jgi:hypothetical protein
MPPRKRIPGGYSEREKRLLQWANLSPAYRARLERSGISAQSYADRLVDPARARGHGSKDRENAMRRVARARKRGLPVDSDTLGYGITANEFDSVAESFSHRGTPDYKQAADFIIIRATAELEYESNDVDHRDKGYRPGSYGQQMRRIFMLQPPDAPDHWYYYHGIT